ncbi:hypothetical protein AVEN_201054-1 [Araneus ventricosus]|uniref:Uncharacterized protein n=1 Tax=Araneus ventricosus TaxID=182803 RepID=A0A4Y2MMG3_ARAVE|nr:hypothetical protein AVEN_201054-1 [Araneus ventricosus]
MRGQYSQAANTHMMKIGSSVDYVRGGGMRNVPVTKAVEHLYATTDKFSGCVLLASRPAYSYPPRRCFTRKANNVYIIVLLLILGQENEKCLSITSFLLFPPSVGHSGKVWALGPEDSKFETQ